MLMEPLLKMMVTYPILKWSNMFILDSGCSESMSGERCCMLKI